MLIQADPPFLLSVPSNTRMSASTDLLVARAACLSNARVHIATLNERVLRSQKADATCLKVDADDSMHALKQLVHLLDSNNTDEQAVAYRYYRFFLCFENYLPYDEVS